MVATCGVGVVLVGALLMMQRPTPGPEPSPSAAVPAGVTVYYEAVGARGVTLYERRLDGISRPRAVAVQPGASYGRTFIVSPDGRTAIVLLPVDAPDPGVAVATLDIASGRRSELGVIPGTLDPADGRWSADGTVWATSTLDADFDRAGTLVVDVTGGRAQQIAGSHGRPLVFETPAHLLLIDEEPLDGGGLRWRFERVDAAARTVQPVDVADLEAIEAMLAPVSLVTHTGVQTMREDAGTRIELVDLLTGVATPLARVRSVELAFFTARGDAVMVCHPGGVHVVTLDGIVREVAAGAGISCYDGTTLSANGVVAGLTAWEDRSVLRVVDLVTGRALELPLPGRDVVEEAHFAGLVGETLTGASLPAGPDPEATAPPAGQPVAGAPTRLRTAVDVGADGVPRVKADRVTPGDGGGLVIRSTMQPIPVPEARRQDDFVNIRAFPAGDGGDVLLGVAWEDGSSFWRWHEDGSREPIALPRDWPATTFEWALSPDGRSIAGIRYGTDPSDADVLIWDVGSDRVRSFPAPDDYTFLNGWPVANAIELGHVVCTEGCEGRYAHRVLVDPRTGKRLPLADDGTSAGRSLHMVYVDDDRVIRLDAVNDEDADDRAIAWPGELPRPVRAIPDAVGDLMVAAGDRVAGLEVFRLPDGIRRAIDGRPPLAPIRLGRLPPGADLAGVSAGRWATTEEPGNTALIDLSSGREWLVGREIP